MQQTSYTCGPAAAVTVLRNLGFPAEEGQIATWAMTCRAGGTDPDILADALQTHYSAQGLHAEFRQFSSVSQLKQDTLAIIKFDFMVDHIVSILAVTGKDVLVGDPLSGKSRYSHDSFAEVWRFSGIVLERDLATARQN